MYASPLERALETAGPIAQKHGLNVVPVEDLGELRMGQWEGSSLAELDGRDDWKRFNTYRSGVRCPGGELMIETQVRMIRQMECLGKRHPGDMVALVSHGDPLRALVAHCLGSPLDLMLRFEISPASVSVVEAGEWGPRVMCLNETGEVPV